MNSEYTITTFGSLSIMLNTEFITEKSTRYKLMWEILLFLISNQGKSFHPETVLEAIFPEKDYTDPAAVMRNQIYLLRKAFDSESWVQFLSDHLLYRNGRYKWDTNNAIFCDAFEFEALISQGKLMPDENPDAVISHYKKALKLYKNYYLADFTDKDWLIPFRTHFHDPYLSAVAEITRLLKMKNDETQGDTRGRFFCVDLKSIFLLC